MGPGEQGGLLRPCGHQGAALLPRRPCTLPSAHCPGRPHLRICFGDRVPTCGAHAWCTCDGIVRQLHRAGAAAGRRQPPGIRSRRVDGEPDVAASCWSKARRHGRGHERLWTPPQTLRMPCLAARHRRGSLPALIMLCAGRRGRHVWRGGRSEAAAAAPTWGPPTLPHAGAADAGQGGGAGTFVMQRPCSSPQHPCCACCATGRAADRMQFCEVRETGCAGCTVRVDKQQQRHSSPCALLPSNI